MTWTHVRCATAALRYGMPYTLNSCHTSVTGNYIVQGHVPSDDPRPFDVVAVGKDTTWVYARHAPRP